MRTTVEIPDHILRRAKSAAALEGRSFKQYLLDALQSQLARSADRAEKKRRVTLPLVPSRVPGSVKLTGDDVARALEAEDQGAATRH